jgi:hypothetical protein
VCVYVWWWWWGGGACVCMHARTNTMMARCNHVRYVACALHSPTHVMIIYQQPSILHIHVRKRKTRCKPTQGAAKFSKELDIVVTGLLRSKGFLWLACTDQAALYYSHAGGCFVCVCVCVCVVHIALVVGEKAGGAGPVVWAIDGRSSLSLFSHPSHLMVYAIHNHRADPGGVVHGAMVGVRIPGPLAARVREQQRTNERLQSFGRVASDSWMRAMIQQSFHRPIDQSVNQLSKISNPPQPTQQTAHQPTHSKHKHRREEDIMADFEGEDGDRRNELVFIGVGLFEQENQVRKILCWSGGWMGKLMFVCFFKIKGMAGGAT